jgi:Cu/Ag efflux protein CusF
MMTNQIKRSLFATCIGGGALALALAASPAFADNSADQGGGKPMAERSATMHATGTVSAIDKSARIVTVKTDAGEKRSVQVGPEVTGFDKLKVGDKVDVEYTESIAVSMLPPGSKPSASEKSAAMKTGKGAGMAGKQTTVSAKVVSVDPAANTITFKGPKGNVETVDVQDPDNQAKLPSIKPGQVMQFTYTEAMAVSVTPGGK